VDHRLLAFAHRLSSLRKEMGWTKEQLADKLECAASTITYYESGQRAPGYYNLLKLRLLFNCTADYIMGLTDDKSLDCGQTNLEQQLAAEKEEDYHHE
jgi:transcriptional regulator with XRE-family HTH domain